MLRGLWMLIFALWALPLLALTLARPAIASDGVLEINQTCAVQTGCFAGDAAGLPVMIDGSAGHSYRLTSDLVVPNVNTGGIFVFSDNVSIDLAGFEIRGPVVCSGTPLVCTPNTGAGTGVSSSTTQSGISVRNGSIRGFDNNGVNLGPQAEVTNVRARSNRNNGIQAGPASTVSGNRVYQNRGAGIFAGSGGSTVSGNTANANGVFGIFTGFGSTISGNTAYVNENDGFQTDQGSTVSGNAAYQNGGEGIQAGFASTISGNTAYQNGGDGIQAGSGSTVLGNTVSANTGFGLNLGAQSGYHENVISVNTAGTVIGASAVNLGNNACTGSLTCP